MRSDRDLWPAVRWPLVVLAVAVVGIVVAAVLDRTAAREWALTIGGLRRPWGVVRLGPSLTVLLPVGLVWLLVAVIRHVVRQRGGRPTSSS